MASIQKSAEKGYRIYWRLHFSNGTYKEKYKTSKSKTTLNELLHDIAKIEILSRRNELSQEDVVRAFHLKLLSKEELSLLGPNMQDPTDHYLHELRADFETKSKAESSTMHSHQANLAKANILDEAFKETSLRKITPELIEKFRADRKKAVTNTTINQDLKALRKYLDIAVNKGYIKENPARKVKLLREPRERIPRCFYPDELKQFFKAVKKFKHFLHGDFSFIVQFLIYTGLRRSELCNLKPENIKLHLRQIHLIGKGQKARVVGINKSLIPELKRRMKNEYIIDRSIHPSSISRAFKMVCKHTNLPNALTLHSLRHTYVSYLLQKGVPPKQVRELAGHFSLSITDRYTHAIPSNKVIEDILDFGQV
jgi:site-specific recombinase XerD